mgnify:CR=1 FL=1
MKNRFIDKSKTIAFTGHINITAENLLSLKEELTAVLTEQYNMHLDMQRLRERILQEFDFNPNYPNVYACGSGMQIDHWYGYPLAEKDVAARIPIKETKPSDDVHPSALGYQQIGDAMTATAWALLNK